MVIRKVITPEVEEIRDTLSRWIFRERRRGLVNVIENLLRAAQVSNVEEKL